MANHVNTYNEARRTFEHHMAPVIEHIKDDTVNEIMLNGGGPVFIEQYGVITRTRRDVSDEALASAIQSVATMNRKDVTPLIDARLPGMRIAAVLPPIAVNGPCMSIRKFSSTRPSLDTYVERGDFGYSSEAISSGNADPKEVLEREQAAAQGGAELAAFLRWLMETRQDLAVVGGTSSGKTTLASALIDCIPDFHRIITVEDTNELRPIQPNVVQLEASIHYDITIRKLIKMCLRLRPDRIVVGETRGAEIFDLLDAMNTGHPGSIFTIHATSAARGLSRMERLLRMSPEMREAKIEEVRQMVADAVRYVVYQAKRGKTRAPEQIIAVLPDLTPGGQYITRTVYDRSSLKSEAG